MGDELSEYERKYNQYRPRGNFRTFLFWGSLFIIIFTTAFGIYAPNIMSMNEAVIGYIATTIIGVSMWVVVLLLTRCPKCMRVFATERFANEQISTWTSGYGDSKAIHESGYDWYMCRWCHYKYKLLYHRIYQSSSSKSILPGLSQNR